jgi:hypothetical protein
MTTGVGWVLTFGSEHMTTGVNRWFKRRLFALQRRA